MLDDVPVTDPPVPADRGFGPELDADEAPPLTARAVTMSIATVATALLLATASVVRVPYAVLSPGPTRDTLGEHDGTPLISIVDAPSYPGSGELRLTTVSVAGGERNPLQVLDVLTAWLDSSEAVRPIEEVVPPEQTAEEIDEANQAEMISSQEYATVAALEELGYEIPTTMVVAETIEGTGAHGVLEPGDVLLALNADELTGFSDLSAHVDALEPGALVVVTVLRDGTRQDFEIRAVDDGTGRALLGVWIDPVFEMPVQVRIEIENIGGASAGTMFALGIIDKLTPEDEAGGASIAGTGTIDLSGVVGAIGGIRQKMLGAQRDGAQWFLAPESNCDDVVGNVPDGMRVVAIRTLSEARAAVTAIGRGDGDSLPTCG